MLTTFASPLKAKAAALILTAAVAVGGTLGGVALIRHAMGPTVASASVPLPSAPPSATYVPVSDPGPAQSYAPQSQNVAPPQPAAPSAMSPAPVPAPSPAPYVQNVQVANLGQQQLDSLLAPIALYPDPLIAEMLPASTYPDELAAAALWLRYNSTPPDAVIDSQPWEPSIKALTHSPSVLVWMYNNPDWTHTLGTAFTYQAADVMDSIQRLRGQAVAVGSLTNTSQQIVVVEDQQVCIEPAEVDVLYVPVYDWRTCYTRHDSLTFFAGSHLGIWFGNDFDWDHRSITVGARWDQGWDHRWDHDRAARTVPVRSNTTIVNNTTIDKTTVNSKTTNATHDVKIGGTQWTRNDAKPAPVLPSTVKPTEPVRQRNTIPTPRPIPVRETPDVVPPPETRTPDRTPDREIAPPSEPRVDRGGGRGAEPSPADSRGTDRGNGDRGNGRDNGRGN